MIFKVKTAFLSVLLLLITVSLIAGWPSQVAAVGTWTAQTSGTSESLWAISCPDANTCYASEGDPPGLARVFKTTNGGTTWSPTSGSLPPVFEGSTPYDIACPGANTCFVVGSGAALARTTDGGSTWTALTTDSFIGTIQTVACADTSTCYIAGASGRIQKTIDGGAIWTAQTSGTSNDLKKLHVVAASTVYVVGDLSTGLKTTNGGTNWTSIGPSGGFHKDVMCTDASTCWVSSDASQVFRTTNGGTSWSTAFMVGGSGNTWNGVHFVSATTGWIVGLNSTTPSNNIFKSTDNGANWTAETSGSSANLLGVYFIDSTVGWSVGNSGTILKYSDSGGGGGGGSAPEFTTTVFIMTMFGLLAALFLRIRHLKSVGL